MRRNERERGGTRGKENVMQREEKRQRRRGGGGGEKRRGGGVGGWKGRGMFKDIDALHDCSNTNS